MFRHHLGKSGIFRHKANARVNGLRPRDVGGGEDGGNVQIAVFGGRRPNAHAFIRQHHGHGFRIRRGMDHHGFDAHFMTGPMNAQSHFPAVGNQHFFKHNRASL